MAEKREESSSEGSSHATAPAAAKKPQERAGRGAGRASSGRRSLTVDPDRTTGPQVPAERASPWQEPRGVQKDIADADKVARTGSQEEPVRNTPPAGAWNDTSPD